MPHVLPIATREICAFLQAHPASFRAIAQLPNLSVQGLMTIGRLSANPEDSRQDFSLLRELFDKLAGLNIPKLDMIWLSMGMTSDFEIAIEEGANLVRIGSAIFGARQQYA